MEGEQVVIPATIGRRIWYKETGLSDQFCDAGICYVFGPYCVNLTVANRNGQMVARTSVMIHDGPPETCPENHACWMPYQKLQAEKQ